GQLNFANVNRIANIERGNVDANEVRQIARQTFDRQGTQILLQQAAHIFDAVGGADRFERHVGLDDFILRDGVEIDVQHGPAHGRVLDFLYEREPALAPNLEFHQNVFTRS